LFLRNEVNLIRASHFKTFLMGCRLFIFFVLLADTAQAQTHKRDSIRKNLHVLNDREAVNGLNALGWQFFYYWIHSDSALKYANLARQKASAINYYSGMAEALVIEGGVKGVVSW
jgi:hypothetical protein